MIASALFVTLTGCHSETVDNKPTQGTVKLDGLTLDQQIAKVRADKSIPEEYKETYITSLRAKAGQGAAGKTP